MGNMAETEVPSIREFFKGKNVLITGGTGFMGKVLIEKLLRSCHTLDTLYVIMRPKKGKTLEERINTITDMPLFDVLKKQQPDAIKKIKPILGNVMELGLGLSEQDRRELQRRVDVTYHAAASVRFDDHLGDALLLNTRGAREVALLCAGMPRLRCLLHVSTTYAHCERREVQERLYSAPVDWRQAVAVAERARPRDLDVLASLYVRPHPNTYTFTKALAEHAMADTCREHGVPLVVFRPSIVISTIDEPIKGWMDNFNGPAAIFLAVGKGILRSLYTDKSIVSDFLPVDLIIKAIIIASWHKGIEQDEEKWRTEVLVYNGSNHKICGVNHEEMVLMGDKLMWEAPIHGVLWYPKATVTKCWYRHFFATLFYQLLPALFIDGLLKLSGRKPILIRLHRKIYIANMALQFFITQEWDFVNDDTAMLEEKLLPEDFPDFNYNRDRVNVFEYFKEGLRGGKRYLLKEDDSTIEADKAHLWRMWIVYIIFNVLWYLGLLYIVFVKIDIISIIYKWLDDFYIYLTTV